MWLYPVVPQVCETLYRCSALGHHIEVIKEEGRQLRARSRAGQYFFIRAVCCVEECKQVTAPFLNFLQPLSVVHRIEAAERTAAQPDACGCRLRIHVHVK